MKISDISIVISVSLMRMRIAVNTFIFDQPFDVLISSKLEKSSYVLASTVPESRTIVEKTINSVIGFMPMLSPIWHEGNIIWKCFLICAFCRKI
jgi:hypothetical protein